MKRAGGLFESICSAEALTCAWHCARQKKRAHRAVHQFERAAGANLAAIRAELLAGTYRPAPLNAFWVRDGRKPRLIEAPSFRDLVVQHSIYAAIRPVLERRYIATSFACRIGLGTHAAADWIQAQMRRAPRTAWALHVDVRRYFYSIDRDVLRALLERVVKCRRTVELAMLFANRDAETGVPIGNLLSQSFSNLYLNSLDHYAKRRLGIRVYARYVDDAVMIAPDRATALGWLAAIEDHLALLGLQLSHYSLQPIRRGVNWCGYRTWASARFVRPHLITAARRDARADRIDSLVSRLGHARRTASLRPLLAHLREHHHAVFDRLPQSVRRIHDVPAEAARPRDSKRR